MPYRIAHSLIVIQVLIEVKEVDDGYEVTLPVRKWNENQIWFCGTGETLKEAIGDFVISNRENLDLVFKFIYLDGSIKCSTKYCRPITVEELEKLENG